MVTCKICGHEEEITLQSHLKLYHGLRILEYREFFPNDSVFDKEYEDRHRKAVLNRDPSYKDKLSKQQKKRWESEEYKITQSSAIKKGQNTEEAYTNHQRGANNYYTNRTETQRKHTVSQIKKSWKNEEKRANRVSALKRAHSSPEGRKNHSEAVKDLYRNMSEKELESRRQKLRDVWAKPHMRRKLMKLSKIGLKAAMSPEACKKKIAAANTPEAKNRRRINMLRILKSMSKVSSLNVTFKEALNKIGLFPEAEYQIDFYLVDFCFPDKKVVVEVDGDYWHGNPDIYHTLNKTQTRVFHKDRREKTFLENRGWKLIRFWESDLKKSTKRCINRVQEALK